MSETAGIGRSHKGVSLLIDETEGRAEVFLNDLPLGVTAVTLPRRVKGVPRLPRNQRQRLSPVEVDLVPSGPVPAFQPPAWLLKRDLIKVLQTRSLKHWATVEGEFGDRSWDLAVALVRAGAIAVRCEVLAPLGYRPISWRLSASWAELAAGLLDELQGKPDPDKTRDELISLMAPVPRLAGERQWLGELAAGKPLTVPPLTAVGTDAWTVYEAAIRAACVWWRETANGRRLTAKELAAIAFGNSKAWTAPQCQGFANLVGLPFDQAVDEPDTEVRLRGPLVWRLGGVAADAARSRPWISLPANGIRLLGDLNCAAKGVFLVENEDTFQKVCEATDLAERWLCIWSKGYASTGLTALLRFLEHLPIAVWGDLDAHGIQIVSDLTKRVGRYIQPVGMDVDAYVRGIKYKQEEKKRVENLALAKKLRKSAPVELQALAQAIVDNSGNGCEQETLYAEMIPVLATRLQPLESEGRSSGVGGDIGSPLDV